MATNVTMSPEQLHELVTSITTAALQSVSNCAPPRSFANASFSFDGARDTMRVEEFISTATVFKSINKISDADAIATLPLVLKSEAATWWQGVKDGIKDWSTFESRLRHAFAPKKPAYLIYQDIFSFRQPADLLTESFIAKDRALLAQLPPPRLRDNIVTFEQLLNAARGVEQLLREKPETASTNNEEQAKPNKQRCDYCRHVGHKVEDCRKRMRDSGKQPSEPVKKDNDQAASTQAPSPSQPVFSCYGCGAPGVVRSRYPNCAPAKQIKTEHNVDFCSLNVNTDARPRPMVAIGIYDIVGTAYIDTCAKSSVASYQLYNCLKRKGFHFERQTVTVTLADGIKRREDILSTKVPVNICNRTFLTTFIVLPQSRENKTLLGVGFIQDAGMVINLPQLTWHFVDRPSVEYEFTLEEGDGITMAQFDQSFIERHVVAPRNARALPNTVRDMEAFAPRNARALPNTPGYMESFAPRNARPLPDSAGDLEACTAEQCIPTKRSRLLFDGTPPDYTDYLYADAVKSIAEAQVDLSPESAALFPGYTTDDIFISAISLENMADLNNEEVSPSSSKQTALAEHTIVTETYTPIVPPDRLLPVQHKALKAKLLKEEIIEPISSAWCAPVVVISSWYRRLISTFSMISELLARLTNKNTPWNRGDSQDKAFNDAKFTTARVLTAESSQ